MFTSITRRVAAGRQTFATAVRAAHTLPDLGYGYADLEPTISEEIMTLHHSKHHQTYVNGLNAAEENYSAAVAAGDVSAAVALQPAVKFNGGGHINHSIFWSNLAPSTAGGGGAPDGELGEAIDAAFGSFEEFKATFAGKTVAVQGSGWGWLGYNAATGAVEVATTANQDPLQATTGLTPLLGVDVWEHAYYLQYKNVRPDYVGAIWDVVNWGNVAERFAAAK